MIEPIARPSAQQGDVDTDDPRARDPRRWYSTNLVGIPSTLLGSTVFNAHPQAMTIAGTRAEHRGLFTLLERTGDIEEASAIFIHYMAIAFGLRAEDVDAGGAQTRRVRASYLRLLQGWGFDANSAPGAVMKGWVESRFGLVPTYHKAPLGAFPSPAWITYLEEKAGSRFHNNGINLQLDLLYEYCQWTLQRFSLLPRPVVRLWRGIQRSEEQFIESAPSGTAEPSQAECRRARQRVLRLNNLVSFSLQREAVQSFGDWIAETLVPTCKVLFYPRLLGAGVLSGEDEVLVIGGDFDVTLSYA